MHSAVVSATNANLDDWFNITVPHYRKNKAHQLRDKQQTS